MQDSLLQWFAQRFMDRRLSPRELLSARKLVYIGLVLVLFFASFVWRRYSVEPQAVQLALLEQTRGDVELSGSLVRLTLTGSRGLATCVLWVNAIEKQKKNQWNELEFYVGALTKLQPHFVTPWLFQSWNLSYNVSVESDRPFDKYFYIARGIQLLAEGERRNQNIPEMRFYNGFYTQHKICLSDETNVMRSLFQLSMIPPSERDPARFRKRERRSDGTEVETINWEQLERFCKENPRLVRRLSEGLRRDDRREQSRQFVCVSPMALINFLETNWRVPSRYQDIPPTPRNAEWQKVDAVLNPLGARFPVLPPAREVQEPQQLFQPAFNFVELNDDSRLYDSVDAQAIARAWYGYAQEPIPPAGDLPGSTEMPTDPIRQRRPKQMSTLLFRQYPALTQTHLCQNLQQEGWFDGSPWQLKTWFAAQGGRFQSGEVAEVAMPESDTSITQWRHCQDMWNKHAQVNHMIIEPAEREINMIRDAEAYWASEGLYRNADPLKLADASLTVEEARLPQEERERLVKERERLLPDQKRKVLIEMVLSKLDDVKKRQFQAALFLYELNLYRSISNFQHHYYSAAVESTPEAVTARKLFAQATLDRYQGSDDTALATYLDPRAMLAWRDKVLAWPDLDTHRQFREDSTVLEGTYEVQLEYQDLAFQKENQYRSRILNTALAMSVLGQRNLAAAGLFSPIPLDLVPASLLQERLSRVDLFPLPFDVPVLDTQRMNQFIPSLFGMCWPGTNNPFGRTLFLAGGNRPLISDEVRQVVRDRRQSMQPQPATAPPSGPAGGQSNTTPVAGP